MTRKFTFHQRVIVMFGVCTLAAFGCKKQIQNDIISIKKQSEVKTEEIAELKSFLSETSNISSSEFSYLQADSGFYYKGVFQIDLNHLRICYSQSDSLAK